MIKFEGFVNQDIETTIREIGEALPIERKMLLQGFPITEETIRSYVLSQFPA